MVLGVWMLCAPFICLGVKVVANPTIPESSLKASEVKDIFTGNKSTWGDNSKIVFVLLKEDGPLKEFLKAYVKKTPSQFKMYWKKKVFTGKGKMPKFFDSEAELLKYVAENKGAIGFIASGDTSGVKEITIQ